MTSAPDLMMQGGLSQFERYAGEMTPQQKEAVKAWLPRLRPGSDAAAKEPAGGVLGIGIDTVDEMRQGKTNSLISFYKAGVGVMFLLFSVSGASGTLRDEVDSGTLDRLLSTRVGMTGLLAGKWLFLALMGTAQLALMFLWGRVAFGLDLFHHLLGGSMFPRFLMSESMQKLGLVTFNAWALDGYLKVFWRDAAIWQLWPQVLVLVILTAVFLTLARTFAGRWEMA